MRQSTKEPDLWYTKTSNTPSEPTNSQITFQDQNTTKVNDINKDDKLFFQHNSSESNAEYQSNFFSQIKNSVKEPISTKSNYNPFQINPTITSDILKNNLKEPNEFTNPPSNNPAYDSISLSSKFPVNSINDVISNSDQPKYSGNDTLSFNSQPKFTRPDNLSSLLSHDPLNDFNINNPMTLFPWEKPLMENVRSNNLDPLDLLSSDSSTDVSLSLEDLSM